MLRLVLYALFSCTLLTACAKPITRAPKLDAGQLRAEQIAQAQLLEKSKGQKIEVKLQPRATIEARLKRVAPRIQKSGTEICNAMWGGKHQCSYQFGLAEEDVLNAWADGKGVYITPKMVSFARNDEELANILAHEYAHNVLKHPQSTVQNAATGAIGGLLLDVLAQSQGINTGGRLSQLGSGVGQLHYSVDFEKEADYVGLYILSRAGYEPNGAKEFWRRFTLQTEGGLQRSRSHPSNPERTLSMQKTAGEIQAKRFAGEPIMPNLRKR